MYLGPYLVYHDMPHRYLGSYLVVLWYVIQCTWDFIWCTMVYHYNVLGILLSVPWYAPQVPEILSDVQWYVIQCTWDLIWCTMVCYHRYLESYQVYHGMLLGTWDLYGVYCGISPQVPGGVMSLPLPLP